MGEGVGGATLSTLTLLTFFLIRKKRLHCLFVDYEKVFDYVHRTFLWQKLLSSDVNGKILEVVKDMYGKAKSCVKVGQQCSHYFYCGSGVKVRICPRYYLLPF